MNTYRLTFHVIENSGLPLAQDATEAQIEAQRVLDETHDVRRSTWHRLSPTVAMVDITYRANSIEDAGSVVADTKRAVGRIPNDCWAVRPARRPR